MIRTLLFVGLIMFTSLSYAKAQSSTGKMALNMQILTADKGSYFVICIDSENGENVYNKTISVSSGNRVELPPITLDKGIYHVYVDAYEESREPLEMTINLDGKRRFKR